MLLVFNGDQRPPIAIADFAGRQLRDRLSEDLAGPDECVLITSAA